MREREKGRESKGGGEGEGGREGGRKGERVRLDRIALGAECGQTATEDAVNTYRRPRVATKDDERGGRGRREGGREGERVRDGDQGWSLERRNVLTRLRDYVT